jgi:hypothetical protein
MKSSSKKVPDWKGSSKSSITTSPVLHSRIGDVDFRTMTLQQAGELIKSGTRYLKKVK